MAGKNKRRNATSPGPADRLKGCPTNRATGRRWLIRVSIAAAIFVVGLVVAVNRGLISLPVYLDWNASTPGPADPQTRPTVTIDGNVFDVELATDDAARRPGLGGRKSLAADRGMLFVYPWPQRPDGPSPICFWMKDCLIDLDIAFISPERQIVTTYTMKAEPPGTPDNKLKPYWPTGQWQFAVELAAGELARRRIKVSDKVEFSPAVEEAVQRAR